MDRWRPLSTLWLKFTAVALALMPLALIVRTSPQIFFKPLSEDGFYSLSVARNLARGRGLTIDGTHLTNGFQPAITVLDALGFLGHDSRALGVRLVLVISWLILLATCVIVALVARDMSVGERARSLAPWLAVVALLSGRYVLYAFNGLETGGEILIVVILWRLFQVRPTVTYRSAATLGAVAGLAVLVRVDAVVVLGVLVGATLWKSRDRRGFLLAGVMSGAAAIVSSPWWVYNAVSFGHLMPTSGRAEQSIALTAGRVPSLVIGLAQDLIPWGYSARTQTIGFSVIELVLAGGAAWWILRHPVVATTDGDLAVERVSRGREFAVLLALALVGLACFYFVETNAVWFYGRYLAPAVLLGAVAGVASLLNRQLVTVRLMSAAVALALLIGVVFTFHFDRNATSANYQDQLSLIVTYVPVHDTVAAGQSGTIGFLRDHVVNLDGKVNAQALAHQNDIRAYLAGEKISWLCDQGDYVNRYLSDDPGRYGWVEVASSHSFQLWHHVAH